MVRSVGYSLGSAISGLALAAGTGTGRLSPDDSAYTTAVLGGVAAMAITTSLALRRSPETNPITPPAGRSKPSEFDAVSVGCLTVCRPRT
ncbi:hypothetical protein SAMN04489729_7873 [Amycolatopsis lurida]|uniref:Major facilitator superfamily (MFS) profile domain-containing protein n=1 Tax=Amycolatopsis lurida NRRL 2430 TaxID=1460371 RepID=A0A2P2FIU3_AMYLU|nr:hypothetical protein [Amycolatopsis lurida]KFU76653.1 hypothetical protein BB31_35025 [Amycolatopsis lurida NRRL 2430]SEE52048.1 hypothetical protein SAMN04489729_7873 [Amycolatopsis lurida]